MEYKIKEFNPSTGAYVRTLGLIKSVNYHAQCNGTSDIRCGAFLNETLTVEVYDSNEAKIEQGAWVSLEIKNNPAATVQSRFRGFTDIEYTFYGIYKVDKVANASNTYTFTAYSSVHDLNVDYSARLKTLGDNGAFPMTAYALLQDVCNYIGYSFDFVGFVQHLDQLTVNKFYANGITVMSMLRAFAELTGTFCADAFGRSRVAPTAPISTQRGVIFKRYGLRANENTRTLTDSGYYLIAPTDAPVDHSAFDREMVIPNKPFTNVFYKQNGFEAGNIIHKPRDFEAVNASGYKWSTTIATTDGLYRLTNNIILDNIPTSTSVSDFYEFTQCDAGAISWPPSVRQSTIRLFPFNCPFRCGDIACVTNADGISFSMPVMSIDIGDYEAVLTCTGNEFYETSQGQYSTPEETGQSNSIEINKLVDAVDELRDTKAAFETGYWTPVLYDNNTQLFSLPDQQYTKVGDMVFCTFDYTFAADTTVNTLLNVRGLPVSTTWGGTVYWGADVTGRGGTTTIQGDIANGRVYFRPNITGTLHSGTRMTGLFIGRA